ncbi:sterol desaturase family protein [Ferrimonas marina]|uniref:Sterol desaturase/sphingolipid hydroxylase, fatty acid hydroxylase superfamily n=1 Tax=Ferrimonas marina TaxID=299255 RepID=A0A1M5YIK7_9GAMM|nr:sterol desaturase family protein [Ferrimonas marina]SHI11373.1 Sterol desaturase/sphingolipid hydroxylase, fatty acid hydroxylase superfamily [Ferrimonas marina]
MEFLNTNLAELAAAFGNANTRLFWGYLLSALLLATGLFWWQGQRGWGAWLRFLFPRRVYGHLSARLDVAMWVINKLIRAATFGGVVLTMVPVALGLSDALEAGFGPMTPLAWPAWAVMASFTLALFLFDDLTRFLLHLALHKVPVLWDIHKVHHSAPVLTPMTVYRSHPLESLLYATRMGLTQGLVVGLCYYLFGPTLKMQEILGANALVFLFNLAGSNLRHSHLWLSWGTGWERWVISPAQHQVHHSDDPAHFDRNLGTALAIWDRLCGTWLPARGNRPTGFGVGGSDPGHPTLLSLYLGPFRDIARRLRRP